jgi:hypothetical protein
MSDENYPRLSGIEKVIYDWARDADQADHFLAELASLRARAARWDWVEKHLIVNDFGNQFAWQFTIWGDTTPAAAIDRCISEESRPGE